MTSGSRARATAYEPTGASQWLVAPLALFLAVYYLAPLAVLFSYSLEPRGGGALTLANFVSYFRDPFLVETLWVTIKLGIETTLITLVIAVPFAYVASRSEGGVRRLLIFITLLPLLTSTVVRSFAWVVILGRRGLVNDALTGIGLIDEPVRLLFTTSSVRIALVQVHLPLVVLPVLNALDRINPTLEQAAQSLGASPAVAFWRIALPLALPGIIAGSVLNFALTISAYVTPALVGGGSFNVLPILIYRRATVSLNWTLAATASVILLVTALAVILVGQYAAHRMSSGRYGANG
jgi:putative spermidine/putrescine transport system permease protein